MPQGADDLLGHDAVGRILRGVSFLARQLSDIVPRGAVGDAEALTDLVDGVALRPVEALDLLFCGFWDRWAAAALSL